MKKIYMTFLLFLYWSHSFSQDIQINNSPLYYSPTGNVGFGATSNSKLFVSGSIYIPLSSRIGYGPESDTFTYNSETIGNYSLGWYPITGSAEARLSGFGGVKLFTNRLPRFIIDSDGKIGIGTSAPTLAQLHVAANANSVQLRLERVGGSNGISADIGGHDGNLVFYPGGYYNKDGNVIFDTSGYLGIGTTSPTEKLSVDGTVLAKKVRVSTEGVDWPDFVFTPNYKLRTLNELEAYIKTNQHLPEVPSAKEVEENGLDLGKMDATLLQKVEELTLYLIEESKEKDELKKENQELKVMFLALKKEIEALKEKNKE